MSAFLAALALAMPTPPACIDPTGISNPALFSLPSSNPAQFNPANPMANSILLSVLLAVAVPTLVTYETPIQGRLALRVTLPLATMAAAYHPSALDAFARESMSAARRRCGSTVDYAAGDALFVHRQVALAYTLAFTVDTVFPEANKGLLSSILTSWGLDMSICDTANCSDVSTPWGLARTAVDELEDFFKHDGFNADGSLSRDFNRVPYEDWRAESYSPVNSADRYKRKRLWQPLPEHDGRGYIANQQHVTPHIGWTARPFVLTNDEVCDARLAPPQYVLNAEALLVLSRTGALNSTKKMEVEFFDNKFTSLIPLLVQYTARLGVNADSFHFIWLDVATAAAIYDATIVGWKEKVRHDLVRPPSVIQSQFRDETVMSYRGPSEEPGDIKGSDWEAYIRIMPHAEYPSGSSCLCRAFVEALVTFEGITAAAPVPPMGAGPLVQPFAAGSSSVEPGKTPDTDIVLTFASWDEVVHVCGESRLDGGMHFTAAVPDGERLCGFVGGRTANYFLELQGGNVPAYAADISDKVLMENDTRQGRRRC